jgi:hypothetical protein
MKRITTSLFLCLCTAAAVTAQELQEPQPAEQRYLPKAGDFALGADATPFLSYLGGFFSQSGATAPKFSGLQGQGIYGKYFLEDNRAIRAKLQLDVYSESYKKSVQDDEAAATTPGATAIDRRKNGVTSASLAVGYELRRGRGRVQGFYGGELSLGLGRSSASYEYGNPMTAANPIPSSYDFGSNIPQTGSSRTLQEKGGLSFSAGLGGFVGVEYFIANQVSLGGELTLGLNFSTLGQDEITTQRVENGEVREFAKRARSAGDVSNSFGVKTVASGSIFLLFHF